MEIRDAVPQDAPAASEVIRRSISELCHTDHLNDPVILGRWLANKTPEIVTSWIVQPGNSVFVAVESGTILAVGSVTDGGEITLNYVSPDARFRGVSRALLATLETRAQGHWATVAQVDKPYRPCEGPTPSVGSVSRPSPAREAMGETRRNLPLRRRLWNGFEADGSEKP